MSESEQDRAICQFVVELDALQRRGDGRVTLEELVEAMGRTDVTAAGVAEVVRGVECEGIASWSTAPNPEDYNRRKILLWLNREHPVVRAALAGEPLPKKPPARCASRVHDFQPVQVNGPPVSEQLIRDRR